jgi:aspartate/methionine/tyrosine aminotransferase
MDLRTPAPTSTTSLTVPLPRDVIQRVLDAQKLDLSTASIREVNRLVSAIEAASGLRFIRMEFGIPGLPAHPIAIEAEVRALREQSVAHVYAPFDGLPALKE